MKRMIWWEGWFQEVETRGLRREGRLKIFIFGCTRLKEAIDSLLDWFLIFHLSSGGGHAPSQISSRRVAT